jgi:hypothetical protein
LRRRSRGRAATGAGFRRSPRRIGGRHNFRTANGSATKSDGDYVARTATPTFAPGEMTKTVTITVNSDSKKEADETFYLDLSGLSSNGLFTKSRGTAAILNDD